MDRWSDAPHWTHTFRLHVLGLEQYLVRQMDPRSRVRLPGAETVYLAGMIARELDRDYLAQIQDYLVEDPGELDRTARQHAPYLGQNAPLVTISRINAEHLTLQIAGSADASGGTVLHLMIPARYFGIAAFYSLQSGNQTLARIFDFFRNHLALVVEIVAGYIEYLEAHDGELEIDPEDIVQSPTWQKFAGERNDSNRRKEFWEAARLNPRRKNRISGFEFRRMIDYTSPN
jgi:hypothetical protein